MMNRNAKKPNPHSRRDMERRRRLLRLSCVVALLLLLLSGVLFAIVAKRGSKVEEPTEPETPVAEETLSPGEQQPPISGGDAALEENPPASYPDPEYNFTIEEVYVPLEGLSKEYLVAWVSDLHLITDREPGPGGISDGALVDVIKRYNTLSITEDGVHAEELWPDIVKFLNKGNYDAVIFGGDMVDYGSTSNMAALTDGYNALRYEKEQILYIRADHDYGAWFVGDNFTQWDIYDLHKALDGDDLAQKYLDMGEFAIIGINNSTQNIVDDYFPIVEAQYAKAEAEGKPIVAVTHVPYASNVDESLKELSMQVRNKEYYWMGHWQPNELMQQYLSFFFGDTPRAKQVLAGHLHAAWDGMITESVREHIFSPAYSGTVGEIHFVPEGTEIGVPTRQRKYFE